MISAVLHHKKQILVAEKYDVSNSCATFHTYNVMTQHRTTIDPPQHTIVPVLHKGRLGFPNENTIATKRPAVVSNTLFYLVSKQSLSSFLGSCPQKWQDSLLFLHHKTRR